MNISTNTLNIIRKMQENEITESVIYKKIAKFAKGKENQDTLVRLSSEEEAHANIWQLYTSQ